MINPGKKVEKRYWQLADEIFVETMNLFGFLVCAVIGTTSALAIYQDTGVFNKLERDGRQLNELMYEDDYPVSRYRESRWESAEWPVPSRRGDEDSYESDEVKPYNWFYYNQYLTNGRYNHLYNGPKMDTRAGMGDSGHRPKILPRPAPSMRKLGYSKP